MICYSKLFAKKINVKWNNILPNNFRFILHPIVPVRFASTKCNKFQAIHHKEDLPNAGYLSRMIGSTQPKWSDILSKHPELTSLKRKDIINSAEMLKSLKYDINEILTKPMILYHNSLTLMNRHNVLRECGCEKITISLLSKYITFMNKSVAHLKSHGYIPFEVDVEEKLRSCFTDLNVYSAFTGDENAALKQIRQHVLNSYLKQRIQMTDTDIEKLWRVYSRVRHKSFKSIQSMIDILIHELDFPTHRIIKNGYVLYGDPENVRKMLAEIKTLDGQDFREILYRRPKILMSTSNSILKTIENVKAFNIGENAITRCLEILTLGSDTVLERLRDLNGIEEFRVLTTNPRVLRLVHYQNKARLRLEYLNQLKVRCASLHILSCGSDAFARFARDGSDKTKGRDIVVFLSNILGQDEHLIRSFLSRHPNWCHIPVIHVKNCYDYLIDKKFLPQDIYLNMHLLLYPIQRIEEKIQLLHCPDTYEELQVNTTIEKLTNNEILTLVLYLIECEFHFTGDGIWTEQHGQQVENFNNLLPDFPESLNKIYKYGVKPAGSLNKNPSIAL